MHHLLVNTLTFEVNSSLISPVVSRGLLAKHLVNIEKGQTNEDDDDDDMSHAATCLTTLGKVDDSYTFVATRNATF